MEKPPPASSADRFVRLIPSGIVSLFVAGLIVAARCYELFPIKPAPCGMRTLTGIPCLGCGGTRAMRALSQGDILAALSFNPLVLVGVLTVFLWFGVTLWRVLSGKAPRSRKKISPRWIVAICVMLGAANWIYLMLNLPD